MVQGRWFAMGSDISQPLAIREAVFGRGADELDAMAWQVVVYCGEAAVGAGRLWWQDGAFRLGEVGVLEAERGKGFGDLLVRLLLFKALTHSAALITLTAPEAIAPFFAKYGFEAGESANGFVGMSIRGESVQLSHCGGNCEGCDHRSPECTPRALRDE